MFFKGWTIASPRWIGWLLLPVNIGFSHSIPIFERLALNSTLKIIVLGLAKAHGYMSLNEKSILAKKKGGCGKSFVPSLLTLALYSDCKILLKHSFIQWITLLPRAGPSAKDKAHVFFMADSLIGRVWYQWNKYWGKWSKCFLMFCVWFGGLWSLRKICLLYEMVFELLVEKWFYQMGKEKKKDLFI